MIGAILCKLIVYNMACGVTGWIVIFAMCFGVVLKDRYTCKQGIVKAHHVPLAH